MLAEGSTGERSGPESPSRGPKGHEGRNDGGW